jgi:hypothetical protein
MALSKPERRPCPNVAEHTEAPEGYLEWHAWARRMGRTHKQHRCPGCKLLTIWKPKEAKCPTR